jgi:hypothetical protein
MDYDKSLGDGVIPDNKVLRPRNRWCYTILDPVFWGENRKDRCPTYGVCRASCSSGLTGRYCQICKSKDVIYVYMLIILKNNRGEEITRMVNAQWILHIFEATHIDARVNRVQGTHLINPWGYTPFVWLKNRMIKKYHNMRLCGMITGKDNKIRSKAIQTVRLI